MTRPGGPEATLRVRGRRIAYQYRPGEPGRVPLVLCNGIGSSMELFDPLVAALDPGRPVLRFDVPGIGGSARPVLPYTYHQLALAMRGLLERLGHGGRGAKADVLGISWGGGLAQQFAFQYPRYCRRAVLVATSTGVAMVPATPGVLGRMLTPRRHRDPEYARSIAGDIYGGSARRDPAGTVKVLHSSMRATPVRGYLYQMAAIGCWTSLPWLPMIRQPTLVLAGDDDPIIPSINGSIMSRLLPRGELHRYPGGHLAVLTEPELLAPVIDEFLDRGTLA
ncbi:MAG TPA: alpha/beta fold hydrolase [Pseudonocardia sp.]|jgi:poly(3-hydroxyalkanoate) depolymerase|uniref:alpha/beta fold hydrolase n=1 Tax=Pseudonocardia sp. TaxID=60912 RepID=UPI002F3F969D